MEVLSIMQEVHVWASAHLYDLWNHHEGRFGTGDTGEAGTIIKIILMWSALNFGGWFVDL